QTGGNGSPFQFTPDDNGSYRIVLTATDDDGGVTSTETTVAVANVAPTPFIASVSSPRFEGTAITVAGSATDPGVNDVVTLSWAVYLHGAPPPYQTGGNASPFQFTPDDNGSYRVVLTAADNDGGVTSTETTVAVSNVAPTPAIASVSSPRL